MTITIPTSSQQVFERSQVDIQNNVPESNPFDDNNFINAIVSAFSDRNFETYIQLENLIRELFLQTQGIDFIKQTFASYRDLKQNPATIATGNIVVEGAVGSPIGLVNLNFSTGTVYTTTVSKTITANSISVVSITRVGNTATVTTTGDHNLASSINASLSGANEVEYNGTFSIIVLSKTVFTYILVGTPTTPATGTIIADSNTALIPVQSTDGEGNPTFGLNKNLVSGSKLTFTGTVTGVNQSAFVDFDGLTGGTDLETQEAFRQRVLDDYRGFKSCFNVDDIIATAKTVPGVTRVFVEEPTAAGPIFAGQVRVFFTRDNDLNIIPSAQDVINVKDKLLTIKTANTTVSDLIVQAPTALVIDFVFSALDPLTTSMKNEITKNIKAFFEDKTSVGVTIAELSYQSVIFNTIDPETAKNVVSFTLTAPVGDIVPTSVELPVFGEASYPV